MTFECTGTSYCNQGDTATVTVNYDGKTETFQLPDAPVCVVTESTNTATGKQCFRFWGQTGNDVTFEYFVCANEAHYQPDASLSNGGAYLIADGVQLGGSGYYYYSGTYNGTTYSRYLETVSNSDKRGATVQSSGDCSACTINGQKVTIFDKNGNQVYIKSGTKVTTSVSCNGCPDGTIKCDCEAYPGYCCLPCAPIEAGINELIQQVKRLQK